MSGFVPRFAVEIAFLALLALAAGLAELGSAWIVGIMVVGWLLVALIEWLAWRSESAPDEVEAPSVEPGPEAQTSWDIEEILAPLPHPESTSPGDIEDEPW